MGFITCLPYYVFLIFNRFYAGYSLGSPGFGQQVHLKSSFQKFSDLAVFQIFELRRDLEVFDNVEDQVDFLLWTRENPDTADKVSRNLTALTLSHFRKDLPTRILIHGYEDTGTTGWVLNVRDAYFIKGKLTFRINDQFY